MSNDRSSVSPYLLRPLRSLDEVQRDLGQANVEQANAVTTQARTIHDRLVAALTARGESVVEDARTTKYTVVTREAGKAGFYYIGKAGALRAGRTVTESRPVAAALRARLLGEA
jgi:hypothetical protein